MRCFVAIELDDANRDMLARYIREDLPHTRDVRWCTPDQLHLSLKFLGQFEDQQLAAVQDIVMHGSAEIDAFTLRLSGLGAFPTPRNPRVLWCGAEDAGGACQRWLNIGDPRFSELGFAAETRAYHPHITLGRSKAPPGERALAAVLHQAQRPGGTPIAVRSVTLFESVLKPTGAEYRALLRAPLRASSPP